MARHLLPSLGSIYPLFSLLATTAIPVLGGTCLSHVVHLTRSADFLLKDSTSQRRSSFKSNLRSSWIMLCMTLPAMLTAAYSLCSSVYSGMFRNLDVYPKLRPTLPELLLSDDGKLGCRAASRVELAQQATPLLHLKIQCPECCRRRSIIYDRYGYPVSKQSQ